MNNEQLETRVKNLIGYDNTDAMIYNQNRIITQQESVISGLWYIVTVCFGGMIISLATLIWNLYESTKQ